MQERKRSLKSTTKKPINHKADILPSEKPKVPEEAQKKLNDELISAAKNSNINEIERLIKKGATIEAKDKDGWTALMLAAVNGHTDTCTMLIKNGADVNAKSNYGTTALMYAVANGHTETCALLLEKGADVNAKDNAGKTALHRAAASGNTDICKLLIEEYAKAGGNVIELINSKDYAGMTPLHYAATNIDTRTCALLMENGADIAIRSNSGNTPLGMAILSGHVLPMEFLASKLLEVMVGNEAFSPFMKSFSDCLAA
jgi:ankyrin repeat protein